MIEKDKREKIGEEFIVNTQNMFSQYYKRAAVFDRLSGLDDQQIMRTVRETPTRIKRFSKALLKKLAKYKINLDKNGEVDYSQCPFPNVVNKLKNNPLVKISLIQKDLNFEYPHLEIQRELAKKIKAEFQEYQVLKEEILGPVEEAVKDESKSSDFDKFSKFEYQGQEHEVKKQLSAKEEEEKDPNKKYSSLDYEPESTYKWFETYEERRLRLEKKWLENRLASFESGLEKSSNVEQVNNINGAIEKLRRIKYLVDQEALKNAQELFFDEHKVLSKEDILIDADIKMEYLHYYAKVPSERKRMTARLEIDDDKIHRIIKRKEILEDTTEPFNNEYNNQLTFEDTEEFIHKDSEKIRLQSQKKKLSRTLELEKDVYHVSEDGIREDQTVLEHKKEDQPKG